MEHTKWNPTNGCQKAAKVIMNGKQEIKTEYGEKTQMGIADLIYRETEIDGLLEACRLAIPVIKKHTCKYHGPMVCDKCRMVEYLKSAISKAEGNNP